MSVDVHSVFLTRHERRTLNRLKRHKTIPNQDAESLRRLGLCSGTIIPNDAGGVDHIEYAISPDGLRYLDYLCDQTRERRWTRSLAIAAIIISLFALVLELDDRGFLGGLLEPIKTTQSVTRVEAPASQVK